MSWRRAGSWRRYCAARKMWPTIDHHENHRRNTMFVEAQVTINRSKAAVWSAITDIEHAAEIMSGIEKIEVVEKPANGLVGLKWKETRMLFGDEATVEKWITEVVENEFYKTRPEDRGVVFITTLRISGSNGGVTLTSSHDTQPQGFAARLMSL